MVDRLVRPGPLGRAVRLVAGTGMLALCLETLMGYPVWINPAVPQHPMLWLGVALAFSALPDLIRKGFSRAWGRWPQLAVVLLASAAMLYDLVRYGSAWGPPLGSLLFILMVYVTGHLGVSFVLASLLATPG